MHKRQGALNLVPLQVTDQVPAHRRRQGRGFSPQFLRPALAKVYHAQGREQGCYFRPHGLGHRDQCDFRASAAGTPARGLDALLHGLDALGQQGPYLRFVHSLLFRMAALSSIAFQAYPSLR
jgi:hypothetical protein